VCDRSRARASYRRSVGPDLRISSVPFDHPDAAALRIAQRAELTARYGTPDSEPGPAPTAADTTVFLLARGPDGVAVGCGALRELGPEVGEVKRMYVVPERRRSGVAGAVLAALEAEAARRGWTVLKLETGTEQPDAMAFYERHGYRRIPNFGHYADSELSVCYERALVKEVVPMAVWRASAPERDATRRAGRVAAAPSEGTPRAGSSARTP
jgi:putative acetyltransferase